MSSTHHIEGDTIEAKTKPQKKGKKTRNFSPASTNSNRVSERLSKGQNKQATSVRSHTPSGSVTKEKKAFGSKLNTSTTSLLGDKKSIK